MSAASRPGGLIASKLREVPRGLRPWKRGRLIYIHLYECASWREGSAWYWCKVRFQRMQLLEAKSSYIFGYAGVLWFFCCVQDLVLREDKHIRHSDRAVNVVRFGEE
jgi:hypothetical protein